MQNQIKKILIIKLGALGDVVMSTSLISQIQKHHAGCEIHLLTSPPFETLFINFSQLRITSLPRKGISSLINMVSWIRKNKFERVYDLQSNDRTRILLALSGVRTIIGNHPYYPYTIHPGSTYAGEEHIFDRMNKLLDSAGIAAAEARPCLPTSNKEEEAVQTWINKENLNDQKLILMHAGASPKHPEKCWPYFGDFSQQLTERGFFPVWLGSDNEKSLNRSFASVCGIDATNLFSLIQLPLLAEKAFFSITNDSGPMHVLSAAQKPIFAFFGPTNWRRNHALGQARYVITNQPEKIEGKKLLDDKFALKNISVASVLSRLKEEDLI